MSSGGGFGAPSVPPSGYMPPYGQPQPPPRRRHRTLLLVIVVIVVVLLVAVIAIPYLEPSSPSYPVQVGAINIWAPDNVCGLNANPIYFDGFNNTTGSANTIDFGMPNFNSTLCTIGNVTTNTTGFSLSAIQVPLAIAGNGTGSMNITITAPSTDYTGDMNLVLWGTERLPV